MKSEKQIRKMKYDVDKNLREHNYDSVYASTVLEIQRNVLREILKD